MDNLLLLDIVRSQIITHSTNFIHLQARFSRRGSQAGAFAHALVKNEIFYLGFT